MVEHGPGLAALAPPAIRLRPRRAQALLGVGVPRGEMARRLRAVGASCRADGPALVVTPPSYRGDLGVEEDLVEEIARVGGYDHVPVTLPEAPLQMGEDTPARLLAARVRGLLVAEGLSEMVTLAFTDADTNRRLPGFVGRALAPLAVVNPLSSETGELRRTPLAGLLRALARNVGLGASFVGAFELGRGYGSTPDGARRELPAVGVVLYGTWPARGVERDGPAVDFLDLKGLVGNLLAGLGVDGARVGYRPPGEIGFLHPGQSAAVSVDDTLLGVLGALHPEVAQAADLAGEVWVAELDLLGLAHYGPRRVTLKPIPRFPAVTRDVAVVVDEPFRSGEIVQEIHALAHPEIESVRLFDCYRGAPVPAGRKSLAYTIAYRAADRTLTDDEVKALHGTVLDRLQHRFRVDFRS
jgi:phenylalanyl-tRNA synthetase beta chain